MTAAPCPPPSKKSAPAGRLGPSPSPAQSFWCCRFWHGAYRCLPAVLCSRMGLPPPFPGILGTYLRSPSPTVVSEGAAGWGAAAGAAGWGAGGFVPQVGASLVSGVHGRGVIGEPEVRREPSPAVWVWHGDPRFARGGRGPAGTRPGGDASGVQRLPLISYYGVQQEK